MPMPGVPELLLIFVIVVMLFGVGKLPEVLGSIGKGLREFRKEAGMEEGKTTTGSVTGTPQVIPPPPSAPMAQLPVNPSVTTAPATPAVAVTPVTPPAADTAQSHSDRALG